MIFITLSNQRATHHEYSNMLIEWCGYSFNASEQELWDHNRGIYKLNFSRALQEKYVALVYSGEVKVVAEVTDLKNYENSDRYYFEGDILTSGNFVHDKWVGQRMSGTRNPVRYFNDTDIDDWIIDKDPTIQNLLVELKKKYPDYELFIDHLKNA